MQRTQKHKLETILMITLVAVMGGAETWTAIALFGQSKKDWFAKFLDLSNGVPSHDTIGRVMGMIDPKQLNACFMQWVEHLATLRKDARPKALQAIAIDGKTLRRSHDTAKGKHALHLLSAWSHEAGLVLAQLPCEQKSNEITAIHDLLMMLELKDKIVTVDALNTQSQIAQTIVDRQGGYVMALKDNQPTLRTDVALMLEEAEQSPSCFALDHHVTEDDGHGRLERRSYTTLTLDKRAWRLRTCTRSHPSARIRVCLGRDEEPEAAGPPVGRRCRATKLTTRTRRMKPGGLLVHVLKGDRWPGLKAVGCAVRHRTDKASGEESVERCYYLMGQPMDAKGFGQAVRGHWGIENSSHWVLDVTFDEDRCRCRKGHSDQDFALIRRLTLNLLRHQRDRTKLSIKSQRLRIGWDIPFLDDILNHVI